MAELTEAEVIIVGGGPAGAAAAWELQRRGRRPLVLEMAEFPREKLCAGWITPEVVADLEMDIDAYPHRFLTFEALNVSVWGLNTRMHAPQHSIRRFEFDDWLLKRSQATVVNHRVRSIQREADGFLLDDRFRCRYLIGAAGTRCPVYREVFREQRPRSSRLQVVTQELEFPCDYADASCHLWFFDNHLPGYSWYVPKADGYLNVGVGAVADVLKRRGDSIKRHWQLLCGRLQKQGLLSQAPAEPGGYSYYIRSRSPDALRIGNAFLTGDAAGLATRDMCEGIGPAIRSGLLAARTILGEMPAAAGDLPRHTLTNPFVRGGLDFALTRFLA